LCLNVVIINLFQTKPKLNSKSQQVGLIKATSLVVGNMIGAGVYVIPAALAGYGSISIIGWVLSALGALVMVKIFGNFSKIIVNKSGEPYLAPNRISYIME